MAAFVDHKFKRGFLLSEEHLRKLNEIIARRVGANGASPLDYIVRREDSLEFRTDSIDEVCADENARARRIKQIIFRLKNDDDSFLLSFTEKGAYLSLSGEDRDATFLLFTDIRTYIDTEVARRWMVPADAMLALVGLGAPIALLLMLVTLVYFGSQKAYAAAEQARQSHDIAVKLNFLIGNKIRLTSVGPSLFVVMGIFITFSIFLTQLPRIGRYVFPYNEFLLGKRISELERRRKTLNYLIGSVFLCSILIPLIISALTSP